MTIAAKQRTERGFTLIELMVSITILAVVGVVLMLVMISASRSKTATTNNIESVQASRASMDLIARDLRSAGYGADLDYGPLPQPAVAYVDSMQILINANLSPYPDTTAKRQPPLAYIPTGTPKPQPLNGTSWTPPIKYRTGAEVVRWTLDLTNDGLVNASDIADPNGVDAQSTPNPDDYMLVRQVYGDSTANVSGFNGGAVERIALVRKPGGSVPPMFTVYLKGSSTPWPWASGPVPANKLVEIERIVVQIIAPSPRADWQGKYAETTLRTEVNSLRNTPDRTKEYAINGFVYYDKDKDKFKDGGEDGISDVLVTVSNQLSGITNGEGFFQIMVPNGTYVLKHTPAVEYGAFDNPDSFFVTVLDGPATKNFADTLRTGGWVTAQVFHDLDKDKNWDGDEVAMQYVPAYLGANPSFKVNTNELGDATLFAQKGGYALYITPPDSFTTSTALPVTGTINAGDNKSHKIGVYLANYGTIKGTVYEDDDLDGVKDGPEKGVGNVWVGVSANESIIAFGYTDGNGKYSLQVPVNDPPKTDDYTVFIQPPPGYPATVTPIDSVFVQDNQIVDNIDFGLGGFLIITADADRVLSVVSGDLYENDWTGGTARRDVDLVLGAEASGKNNVMVWFNDYDDNDLFDKNPTYSRNAPHSVLSLAMDSLDVTSPRRRLDLVSGTRYTAAGNFFVWLTQNTSGNEGYIPDGYSPGHNYKTLDNGDVVTILTRDIVGTSAPDIIVGTRGPISGQGIFEVWENTGIEPVTFTRHASYPPAGSFPTGVMGEANAMAIADFDKDGNLDLVVGTRTHDYGGQLLFFEQQVADKKWKYDVGYTLAADVVTSLAVVDVNDDGWLDVVTGTYNGLMTGKLQWWRNDKYAYNSFSLHKESNAPGQVMCLAGADISGIGKKDVIIGWREDNNTFKGGVQIWYTSTGLLPDSGIDPSAGKVKNFVTAITTGNFNYGVFPATPSAPYLTDFAVGVKRNATSGDLVVFIR